MFEVVQDFPCMLYHLDGRDMVVNNRRELNDAIASGFSMSRSGKSELELLDLKIASVEQELVELKEKRREMMGEPDSEGVEEAELPRGGLLSDPPPPVNKLAGTVEAGPGIVLVSSKKVEAKAQPTQPVQHK